MGFIARMAAKFKKRPPLTLSSVDVTRKPSPTPVRLPDGTADPLTAGYKQPKSLTEIDAETGALGPVPDAPIAVGGTASGLELVEGPRVQWLAKRKECVTAAQNAHVNDPAVTTAESLGKSKSGWATQLKKVLINNFIVIALAGAVGTYFLVTAEMRRQCIKKIFAEYPQFMNADAVEKLMAGYANKPCDVGDKQCDAVHDAYQRLKDCDNSLMKNIFAAAMNTASDVVDWGRDEVGKTLEKLFGSLSGVLPIVLGVVGAIILACIALWFFTRERGAHGHGNRPIENLRGRIRRFRGSAEQAFGRHMRVPARFANVPRYQALLR